MADAAVRFTGVGRPPLPVLVVPDDPSDDAVADAVFRHVDEHAPDPGADSVTVLPTADPGGLTGTVSVGDRDLWHFQTERSADA